MPQWVAVRLRGLFAAAVAGSSAFGVGNSVIRVGITVLGLLLAASGRSLAAQSRSTLQVAAVVVQAQPSQAALASALAEAQQLPAPSAPMVASIQVEPAVNPGGSAPVGTLSDGVTISFLYN